ncbi:hypothetical protein U1Q18_040127 [Sarracenia purpurea var. burkii]
MKGIQRNSEMIYKQQEGDALLADFSIREFKTLKPVRLEACGAAAAPKNFSGSRCTERERDVYSWVGWTDGMKYGGPKKEWV